MFSKTKRERRIARSRHRGAMGGFLRCVAPPVRGGLLGTTALVAFGLATSGVARAADPQFDFGLASLRGTVEGDEGLEVLMSADGSTLSFKDSSLLGPLIVRPESSYSYRFTESSTTFVSGLSADGSAAAVTRWISGNSLAQRWENGVVTDLGTLGGGSTASAISADGSTVIGVSTNGSGERHAFRWAGGTMADLGTLPGATESSATAVSADGAVVVGSSTSYAPDFSERAFRWSGGTMTDLGTLGGAITYAVGVSADGSVVAGDSQLASTGEFHAFRWSGGVMTDLGTFSGRADQYSNALAISADGTAVIGTSQTVDGSTYHAFQWSGGVMTDLGSLAGAAGNSRPTATSSDGSVVVGASENSSGGQSAFRWDQQTGMRSMTDLLTASGVDMTGWSLYSADSISANGRVIAGIGRVGGDPLLTVWIARCTLHCAVITPGILAQSLASTAQMGRTGNAALTGALGTSLETASQAFDAADRSKRRFSVFAHGLYDSDPTLSADIGATFAPTEDIVIGAKVGAAQVISDLAYGGSSRLEGMIGSAFAALAPKDGLQAFVGVSGSTASGVVNRGYLNGNTLVTSTGSTSMAGVAANMRIGWAFDEVMPATRVTPFAGFTAASTWIAGWTERDGPFPASFAPIHAVETTSRLGMEARYTLDPGRWIWGSAAWGHRFHDGRGATVAASLADLGSFAIEGSRASVDWVEVGAGYRVAFADAGVLTTSVAATVPERGYVTWLPRVGLAVQF